MLVEELACFLYRTGEAWMVKNLPGLLHKPASRLVLVSAKNDDREAHHLVEERLDLTVGLDPTSEHRP
jgi:hypothetical protein